MKVLHLTLKKQWFDLIASGEKKEEYREIKKYWITRLVDKDIFRSGTEIDFMRWFTNKGEYITLSHVMNRFDVVCFKNGYSKDSKLITLKFRALIISEGRPEWGAEPGKKYFVIKLGEKIPNDEPITKI